MSRSSRGRESDYSRDDRRSRFSDDCASRVYIGNINAKSITERDAYDWMNRYGRIQDIALFERQILVQYEREADAKKAVDREKGQTYRGYRFDIRIAFPSDGSISSTRRNDSRRSPQRSQSYTRDSRAISPPAVRGRSPIDRSSFSNALSSDRATASPDAQRVDRPRQQPDTRLGPMPEAPEVNFQSPPFTDELTTERPGFDAAIIVMSSDLLRYAESIEAKLQRQIALTTHIIVLKEELHAQACVEDLTNKGVLYAFLVNKNNEIQNNCTLRILYGYRQEHRNMPLPRAFTFVSENFENYQKRVRDLKAVTPKPNFDPSLMPPGFVAPDDKIIYYCHLLADSRMLTIDELEKVADFISLRLQTLTKAEGRDRNNEPPKGHPQSKVNSATVQNSTPQPPPPPQPNTEKVIALQNQLHSRLNNILKPQSVSASGGSSVSVQSTMNNSTSNQLSSSVSSILPEPSSFAAASDHYSQSSGINSTNTITSPKSTNSNFLQNPSVQQALDTLMHANQFNNRPNDESSAVYSTRPLMHPSNTPTLTGISSQYSMGNKPGGHQARNSMILNSYAHQYPQVHQPIGNPQVYYPGPHTSVPQMPHQPYPGHPQQHFYRGRPPFGNHRQAQYPHGGSTY